MTVWFSAPFEKDRFAVKKHPNRQANDTQSDKTKCEKEKDHFLTLGSGALSCLSTQMGELQATWPSF